MRELNVSTSFKVYDSVEELEFDTKKLMEKAIEIRKTAYAPYSNFLVGVALELDNGEIITGTNQENAAYPSGLCAERVAIFYTGSKFPNAKILKLCITASPKDRDSDIPIPPCGACRQSIAEYEFKQDSLIEIYFMGAKGEVYKSDSLQNLLPLMFDKNHL
ncbi:cytidine deaminase [uncultured Flavobacterium sp.]|uniref:cytidine deaminase n=1 Tax=uncultured Flavobacterium sp. TaxID=165435 RepID=UPI0030C82205